MAKKPGSPRSAAANANAGETKRSAKIAPALRTEHVEQLTNLVTVCIAASEESVEKAIVARDATRSLAEALRSHDIITDAAFIQSPSLSPDMKDGLPGTPAADSAAPIGGPAQAADVAPAVEATETLPAADATAPLAPTPNAASSTLGGEYFAEINSLPEGAALDAATAAALAKTKPIVQLVSAPAKAKRAGSRAKIDLPENPGVILASSKSRRPQAKAKGKGGQIPKRPAIYLPREYPALPKGLALVHEVTAASTDPAYSFYLMATKYGINVRQLIDIAVKLRVAPYGAADGQFSWARIATRQNFAYRVAHNLTSKVRNRINSYIVLSTPHQIIDYCYGGLVHSLGLRRKGLGEITYIVPDVLTAEVHRLDPDAGKLFARAVDSKAIRIQQAWSGVTLNRKIRVPEGCTETFAHVKYAFDCYRRSVGYEATFLILPDCADFAMVQALHDEPVDSATLGTAPDYGDDKSTRFFMLNQDFLYALSPLLRLEGCTGPNSHNLARLTNRSVLAPDLPIAQLKLLTK